MYIGKYATSDAIPVNKKDPENMTSEEVRKIISSLRHHKDKATSKNQMI